MHISAPRISREGDFIVVSADFQCGTDTNTLWFKVPSAYQDYVVSERGDAFLVGLLLYAMVRGEDIQIECPISEKLFYNLTNHLIPALSIANPKWRRVTILPCKLESESINSGNAVGTGFSGGVDSFCTIYEHFADPQCPPNYRLTHLVFLNVGSHGDYGGKASETLFKSRFEYMKAFPKECGLDFVMVDSNLSEILQMKFVATSCIRSMAPVLLLQKLFRVYLFSSTSRIDQFRMMPNDDGDYQMLILSMLSTESLSLYSSGIQYTRVEKTAIISGYEPTWRHLNVCVKGCVNCSKCYKCTRTMLTLDILGVLDRYAGVFDLSLYRKNKISHLANVLARKGTRDQGYLDEIHDEIVSRGIQIPFQSRLLHCGHVLLKQVRNGLGSIRLKSRLSFGKHLCIACFRLGVRSIRRGAQL